MISALTAKKLLGSEYQSLTEDEVEQFVAKLYTMADIISDQVKANVSNQQLRVIDSASEGDQNGVKGQD